MTLKLWLNKINTFKRNFDAKIFPLPQFPVSKSLFPVLSSKTCQNPCKAHRNGTFTTASICTGIRAYTQALKGKSDEFSRRDPVGILIKEEMPRPNCSLSRCLPKDSTIILILWTSYLTLTHVDTWLWAWIGMVGPRRFCRLWAITIWRRIIDEIYFLVIKKQVY